MPLIGVILSPGTTEPKVGELHNQLFAVGAVIAPGEQTAKSYGDSTVAAVRAFRQQYGLPAGDVVDLPTGRLMHVASTFASGGRVPLRAAVREAASAADTSEPQELYWLARYATLAGDYQTAHDIGQRIPDHGGVKAVIDPILFVPEQPSLGFPPPRPPEVPYPENFYAYRRPWVDPNAVDRVRSEWSSLKPEEHQPRDLEIKLHAILALRYWNEGNVHFTRRRYAAAVSAYDACEDSVIAYFDKSRFDIQIPAGNLTDRSIALIKRLYELRGSFSTLWDFFQRRRELLSLTELEEHDRIVQGDTYDSAFNFVRQMGNPGLSLDPSQDFRERNLEAPLVTLAFVLAPLARAEANRARRQYAAAVADFSRVQTPFRILVAGGFPQPDRIVFVPLTCDFIERPFAELLGAETLLDQADAEYKARIAAEPPPAPDVAAFQGLKAAQTYLAIKDQFKNEGRYVKWVDDSRDRLTQQIQQRLAVNDTRSQEFQLLGKDILVPTLTAFSTTLPGLDRRAKAHEPLLKFTPEGQEVMRETNPRVYAILLTAAAHLEQLKLLTFRVAEEVQIVSLSVLGMLRSTEPAPAGIESARAGHRYPGTRDN